VPLISGKMLVSRRHHGLRLWRMECAAHGTFQR
jgi:hypothetical protein